MCARRSTAGSSRGPSGSKGPVAAPPRIIGGELRGKTLLYSGDERTRPMKDRVREAIFNLLGPAIVGKQVLDLFAGTGALGFEALSRGAAAATFVERHFPTAAQIRQSAAALGVAERTRVEPANALIWIQQNSPPGEQAWVSFVSPPWALFSEIPTEMGSLIERLVTISPPGSIVVVEGNDSLDVGSLPQADLWDIRDYRPAIVAIFRVPGG